MNEDSLLKAYGAEVSPSTQRSQVPLCLNGCGTPMVNIRSPKVLCPACEQKIREARAKKPNLSEARRV